MAAALAVIVPTAFLAGGGLNRSQEPDPVRPPAEERVAVHTRLTLDGVPRGDAPGIEYFTEDGVVLPDEGLVEQELSWQALIPSEADGGWIAFGPARGEVRYLSEEFEDQGGSGAGDALVSSADRSYVAWTASEPGAQTLRAARDHRVRHRPVLGLRRVPAGRAGGRPRRRPGGLRDDQPADRGGHGAGSPSRTARRPRSPTSWTRWRSAPTGWSA